MINIIFINKINYTSFSLLQLKENLLGVKVFFNVWHRKKDSKVFDL